MNSFNIAQTFYLDPAQVQNASHVNISALDLYFQAKPDRTNNYSGIVNPGVSAFLTPTKNRVPVINPTAYIMGRLEYDQIATSSDASIPTRMRFPTPVGVDTGTEYALVLIFDGGENFQLWTSTVGEFLVQSSVICAGPTGKYIGLYYTFNNSSAQANATSSSALQDYQSFWTPQAGTDLKFTVYAARYATSGYPVGSNAALAASLLVIPTAIDQTSDTDSVQYIYPATNMEFVLFDQSSSVKETFVGGQMAFQNTISYPGGWYNSANAVTVSVAGGTRVTANTLLPNGASFSWNNVFNSYAGPKYIVLNSNGVFNVRQVNTIVSNTIIEVVEPCTFVNSSATFMLTPVAQVDSFNKSSPFGHSMSIVMLANSSANSSVRFVNSVVESVSIVTGGSGYSNSDVFYVTGFESVTNKITGGYIAVANVSTNGSGGITALHFSNVGCGFTNAAAATIVITAGANTNPTSNTSAGTSANLQLSIGATIQTDLRPNIFRQCQIVNFDLADITPYFDFNAPSGTSYTINFETNYYIQSDTATLNQYVTYVDDQVVQDTLQLQLFQRNLLQNVRVPCYPSHSNEWNIKYANGSSNDRVSPGTTSNAIVMSVDWKSNNDFICVSVNSVPTMSLGKYIVNNDYTNENTDFGNAWARQITTQIPFGRLADDLLVYLTAYKASVNDVQVYARMYNSTDPDYFEDKAWTRLQQHFTSNLVSSTSNQLDWVELTYGLQAYPNTDLIVTGTATTQLSNNAVVGTGTSFNTQLQSGDLLMIHNPLFKETYWIDVVNTVTNSTYLTLNNPVSNTDLAGYGFSMELIRSYKHQAFLNNTSANTARYYNLEMAPLDGYDTVQIKVIMLSSQPNLIPRIDDIRGIGVSA